MSELKNKKFILQTLLLISTSLLAYHWNNGWVLFWEVIGTGLIDK